MKPRKPDRFERMVRKEQWHDDWGIAVVLVEDVIHFLRNEHAWMKRMVTNYLSKWRDRIGPSIDAKEAYGRNCRALQCEEILSQLKQRRK